MRDLFNDVNKMYNMAQTAKRLCLKKKSSDRLKTSCG